MSFVSIHDRAIGKWRWMLPHLGIDKSFLSGKHGPCPICREGKDRFRFTDRGGHGMWICNQCGAGNGIDLVMRVRGLTFIEAKREVEPLLNDARVEAPNVNRRIDATRYVEQWRSGQRLDEDNLAGLYLQHRGLQITPWPALRYLPKATYWHDDRKTKTEHPALAALYAGPDRQSVTVHFTYLDDEGRKADLPKVRKLAPAPIPRGGAVRLMPSAETMGIAEGIETALAAHQLHDVPVWAALSAGGLIKWQPPEHCRHVIVFGDHDPNFTGQSAAYSLAHRLSLEGYGVEVRVPDLAGDWNDVLMMEAA